jgi:hypothetical protein
MAQRRWLHTGIVVLVITQAIAWLFAGSIWWSFRGGIIWKGEFVSQSRVANDSYLAIAFFAVAGITVAAVLLFLVRPGEGSTLLLASVQLVNAAAAFALTLAIEKTWVLITALAIPTLVLLYFSERRQSVPAKSNPDDRPGGMGAIVDRK